MKHTLHTDGNSIFDDPEIMTKFDVVEKEQFEDGTILFKLSISEDRNEECLVVISGYDQHGIRFELSLRPRASWSDDEKMNFVAWTRNGF